MFVYQKLNATLPYALPEELEFIRQEALKLGANNQIVMIGAGPAVFALAALEKHPDPPKMTIVDVDSFYYAEAHMRGASIDLSKVEFRAGDSSTVGLIWQMDNPIDLLIVDGDHSYRGVLKDLRAWGPHLKVGGILFCHDVYWREGGFGGSGEWLLADCFLAIEEECVFKDWEYIGRIGIGEAYRKI